MKKCLIVTDYQYDFADANGVLSAGQPALDIQEYIFKKVQEYLNSNNEVIFSLDTHYKDSWQEHPESKAFNLHCEKGTKGWELYGKLNTYMKSENTNIKFIEKTAYCFDFQNIQRIIENFDEVEIVGLVTDICVLNIAIVLYTAKLNNSSNINIIIDEHGCASFNKEGHNNAINYMKNILGLEIRS